MARFYGEIQGNRGSATRMGSETSGFTAHIRGWDVGVRIVCRVVNGVDVISVYQTSGSNHRDSDKLIRTFTA